MRTLASLLALLFSHFLTAAVTTPATSLEQVVRSIRSADYRGERAELARLADRLDRGQDPTLAPYRLYWRGFALWRRALNGFNETPKPPDLESDLRAAILSFEAAQREKPDWIEPGIGIVGCAGPLYFLAQGDAARMETLFNQFGPLARDTYSKASDNPRALWLMGQTQLGAPPPYGGDPAKAAATFHRGIEAARAEARGIPDDEPAWIPRWGGAENLMNLAYLHVHSTLKNRDLALAYAEGAIVAAPEWHYLRDILWPKILDLPSEQARPIEKKE